MMRTIKENTWVKCVRNDELRYVTRYNGKDMFEDDGTVSGQSPSPWCHDEHYEPVVEPVERVNKCKGE